MGVPFAFETLERRYTVDICYGRSSAEAWLLVFPSLNGPEYMYDPGKCHSMCCMMHVRA